MKGNSGGEGSSEQSDSRPVTKWMRVEGGLGEADKSKKTSKFLT